MERQFKKLGLDVEFVEAVEGRELTAEKIREVCDMNAVNSSPNWLRPGIIACALSHRLCCEHIMKSDEPYAVVLEDDVILDKHFRERIDQMAKKLAEEELILLYFQSFSTIELSEEGVEVVGGGSKLFYPINYRALGASGAYLISKKAAANIYSHLLPLRTAIDAWGDHVKWGYLKSIRLAIPFVARSAYESSAVDYYDHKSWNGKFKYLISSMKIFPFHQLLQRKRKMNWQKMTRYSMVSDRSAIQP